MLSVLRLFLSKPSNSMSWWMVVVANWLTWCRGVPRVSVLGQQLSFLHTTEPFSIVEDKLYGFAYDSTLVAVVLSPAERVAVPESMNRDTNKVVFGLTCVE